MQTAVPKIHRATGIRGGNWRLLYPAVLAACLCGALWPAESRTQGAIAFDRHELDLDAPNASIVLTGDFLGNSWADVVTVHVGADGHRRVLIHAFDGNAWHRTLDIGLQREVRFIDVARIGDRDRLLTSRSGGLSWLDPARESEVPLLDFAAALGTRNRDAVQTIDISRDLNGDGLDDIVVPDVDGFWISTQRMDGTFTDAVKLGPEEPFRDHRIGNLDLEEPGLDPEMRYGDVGITAYTADWYQSRVHTMDHNLDGRVDLVFWNDDHFDIHYQDEHGTFAAEPVMVTTDIAIDSAGAYSRVFEFVDDGVGAILFGLGKKTARTILYEFRDMNGDDVDDLVTVTLSGRSVAKQKSEFSIYFGEPSDDGINFTPETSATLRPRGKAGAMQAWGYSSQWFQDFDGDGGTDVLFRNVNVGLGGMTRALAGKSIAIDLEYFRMEDGAYPEKAGVRHKIRPTIKVFGRGGPFFPAVLVGDVNGDGLLDLVYGKNRELLLVHPGVPGKDGFADTPVEIAVSLPADERDTRLVDLNDDGKKDLLVIHRSDTEPTRLTLLIAR